jgi:tetratricopeptide (TPR) repeat protein
MSESPQVPRLVPLALALASCAYTASPTDRSLHVVDGKLVSSRPIPAAAYEAYLRARLALDADPPRLDEAYREITVALRADPRDPHLWTTRAEIESRLGEESRALASLDQALDLRPDYPPAKQLRARLDQGQSSAATSTRPR